MTTEHVIKPKAAIQPRSVQGRFRNLKTAIMVLAYGVFFILPWIRWERAIGPDQAVIFDIPGRRYYLFDLVVHAQDIFWLSALLFLAAVLLFFVTSLLGRVFCGYFCFQTLWMDAFRLIEKRIQGDRVARVRLDKQPWNLEKIIKKGSTHALWIFLSLWTGFTFAAYWTDAYQFLADFVTFKAAAVGYFTVLILTITTYVAAGWIKEFVCMHICPYSRFQSVMFDTNTMIVSYDPNRGEGEKGRAKPIKSLKQLETRKEQGHGDCVDCGLCVQVCPVGIDIRDGLQIACIHCALCIDACDGIMDKMGWERGLIRYTSENELEGKKTRYFTLRTVGYGIATLLAAAYLVWSVMSVKQLEATAAQVRNPLFVQLSDGRVQNSYEVKINNKSMKAGRYQLELIDFNNAELSLGNFEDIHLKPDSSIRLLAKVKYMSQTGDVQKNREFQFKLTPLEGEVMEPVFIPAHFILP